MKFVVSASVLLKHLTDVSRIMSSKVNMTLLHYAHLSVRDEMLTLRYTDLTLTIVTSFPLGAIESEGEVCVPLKLLMDSVKGSPDVPLHFDIDVEGKVAKVTFDDGMRRGDWSFKVEGSSDYYEMPEIDESRATSVVATSDVVSKGFEKTLFCAAPSSSTNQISVSAVRIEFTPDGMFFGATDTIRIARYSYSDVRVQEPSGVTVQSKAAQVILALLPQSAEELSITFDDRIVLFSTPSIQIYSLLSDNRYPSLDQFLQQPVSREVVVNTRLLLDSVRQLAPFSTPSTMNAQYEFSDSQIRLQAYSDTYSASAQQLIASDYRGEAFSIMLSIPLFSEILQNMPSQDVVLQFNDDLAFVMVRPAQPGEEGVDYLIYLAAMLA